jgi:DNA-binding NarL/FixJ family response regulator
METINKIKIVLAEDHPVMRQGLRHLLEQYPEFEVIGEAGDGEQAFAMTTLLHPDVLVCDVRLPLLNGIDVVRRLKSISSATKTLMLSAFDDEVYVAESIRAGASGYLLKTVDPNELAQAVKKIQSNSTVFQTEKVKEIEQAELQDCLERQKRLTAREWEVLSDACHGLDNEAIAAKLSLSNRTVEKHFENIYGKLAVSSRKEAIQLLLKSHAIQIPGMTTGAIDLNSA